MSTDSKKTKGPGQIPAYDMLDTHYPVVNVNQALWNPLLTKFRRAVSSFNPFATQQVPSQDRIAFGPRWGNQFYRPDPYPNGVSFYRMAPSHYDPLDGMNRKSFPLHHRAHGPGSGLIPVITSGKYPRGCTRAIQTFERCQMINGAKLCNQEANEILNVCPKWTVDDMVTKKKFKLKVIGIQNELYRRVLKVSNYNKGRSVADLEDKTWLDGTRTHLRPDTMWADDRYATITQTEINEAKVRHAERQKKKPIVHAAHSEHHYDWIEAKRNEEAPLYP